MVDLFSRNHFYIDKPLQAKIAAAKLVFLDTGLASTIAEVMVRTGFTHFVLCDGDRVETSNLNRQNFESSDVGYSKVKALQKRLQAINPDISCSCVEGRFERFNQLDLEEADIIINTIDCGPLYFELIETYRKKGKLIICPFNAGFAGLVACFTDESGSAFDFFETDKPLDDLEIARCLLRKTEGSITNKRDQQFLDAVVEKGYFPQLAISANLTAALAAKSSIKYLNRQLSQYFYYIWL